MNSQNQSILYTPIEYEQFKYLLDKTRCTAYSARFYRPTSLEQSRSFSCSVKVLLELETYSIYATNATRDTFLNYDHPDARPILFRELIQLPILIQILIDERKEFASIPLTSANLLSLHCSTCNRHIIVDGTHRLTRLGYEQLLDAKLNITEVSGAVWPIETPDFNLVCGCNRTV